MSSSDALIIKNISKSYQIYGEPSDRLRQFIFPRVQRLMSFKQKQYYVDFPALKNINFKVQKGETVGVVGRNGSGKSTLLQLICGTLNPSSGECFRNGRMSALLELGSGFNSEFTGFENIYMNAAILGLSKIEVDERLDEILAFADIGDFIKQPVKTYSSGMLIRLAFSISINMDPDILLIDEALAVGDELFQRKCMARIDELKNNGCSILFVSHSANQITEICNRAILLDQGQLIRIGEPNEVIKAYQKLLYANPSSVERIRAELMADHDNETCVSDLTANQSSVETYHRTPIKLAETFDPFLVPQSSVNYEVNGAEIINPQITTLNGDQVNGLLTGRRYIFKYDVKFKQNAVNVRFGTSIKNKSGLLLAGAFSAAEVANSLTQVSKGTTVTVQFGFDCSFNPGLYFVNAGAYCFVGDDVIVLHRRIEVAAFRVLPFVNNLETEVVHLNFEPTLDVNE